MGWRAHDECIERAEYGELMKATQGHVRATLDAERRRRGISQQRLAAVIGVNREAMRDRLIGRTQLKAEELAALAAFLDVDVGAFYALPPAP